MRICVDAEGPILLHVVSSPFGIACHTTNRHRAEVSQLQEGFTAYKGHLLRSMHQSLSCVLYKSFSSPDLQPSPSHLDPLRPFDMPSIQTFGAAQAAQNRAAFCSRPAAKASPVPARAVMVRGHSEGGPFSPLVVVTRNVMGKKEFNSSVARPSPCTLRFAPTSCQPRIPLPASRAPMQRTALTCCEFPLLYICRLS